MENDRGDCQITLMVFLPTDDSDVAQRSALHFVLWIWCMISVFPSVGKIKIPTFRATFINFLPGGPF